MLKISTFFMQSMTTSNTSLLRLTSAGFCFKIALHILILCQHYLYYEMYIQWNLCNPTPEFSDILRHPTKIYGPKVFLLTKLNLSIPTSCTIRHFSLAPWCVGIDRFHCSYVAIILINVVICREMVMLL